MTATWILLAPSRVTEVESLPEPPTGVLIQRGLVTDTEPGHGDTGHPAGPPRARDAPHSCTVHERPHRPKLASRRRGTFEFSHPHR